MNKLFFYFKRLLFSFWIVIGNSVVAFADEEFEGSCKTLKEFESDGVGNNFLLKEAYEIIADACSSVASLSWNTFAKPLIGVVVLGAAIYIAIYTLKNLGSFSQQDTAAYLSSEKGGVIPLCCKLAIVVCLLSDVKVIYEYLIFPIVNTGLEIGHSIGGNSSVGIYGTTLSASSNPGNNVRTLFNLIIKQAQEFNDELYQVVALSRLMICISRLPDSFLDWYYTLLIFGGMLYLYGWFLILCFSFYVIDVLFRFGVACIVLPMGIACGISKLTSSYTKKTWDLFANVTFNFIMLGVIVSMILTLVQKVLFAENLNDIINALFNDVSKHLNKADVDAISDGLTDSYLRSFILISLICMVCFKLFAEVETITDKISGTKSVGNAGKQVGGAVSKPLVAAGKKIGSWTGKFLSNSAKGIVSK